MSYEKEFQRYEEDHVKDVDWDLTKLLETGMRVSQEKSKFFKKNVEYLGFIVSQGGLRTSPEKRFTNSDPSWE